MKITLKPITIDDASFLVELMKDKEFQKHYLKRILVTNLEEADKYIKDALKYSKKGDKSSFTIYLGKEKVGLFNIYKINERDKRGSIGFAVIKKHWKKGIATKATKLGIKLLKQKGVHTVEATTNFGNSSSERVLEKCGFKKIGLMKDYYYDKNKYVDRVLYWKVI